MPLQHARNRDALGRASQRAADLLRAQPTIDTPIPNSEWTIGEAAAHTIASLRTYGSWALGIGEPEQIGVLQNQVNAQIARMNEQRIATVERESAGHLAEQLLEATGSFLEKSQSLGADHPFEWYDHIPIDLKSITAIMLAEVLVHFWDIAKAAEKPWPIDPVDADQMMLGALALSPYYVNKETTRGVKASYDIRVRGGSRVGIRLDDGVATIQEPPDGRYDCIISADPVTLLLVSYGRIGLVSPVLTGKIVAFGKKPWLGLKFNSYFLKP